MKKNSLIFNEVQKLLLRDEVIIKADEIILDGKRKKNERIYFKLQTNKRKLFIKFAPGLNKNIFESEHKILLKVGSDIYFSPRPIGLINKGIVMMLVEGQSLDKLISDLGLVRSKSLLLKVVLFIAKFHEKTKDKILKKSRRAIYLAITGKKLSVSDNSLLTKVNFGFVHGDLDPFNTLCDIKNSSICLVDWEDFSENGIQELDILHFIIMLGVIINPGLSNRELYNVIFKDKKENQYINLLSVYCRKRSLDLLNVLSLIPIYCESQNRRLVKAKRDANLFLYNDFINFYYERK